METLRPISLLFVLLTLASAPSPAQILRDSRGTDFWLAFMPNDRSTSNSSASLHISITAETATSGVVSAVRRNGTVRLIPFTIAQPNALVTLQLLASEHELAGGDYGSSTTGDAEMVLGTTVHITGQAELSVYAVTRETQTTDAWLVLPTDALGTEYRVMSYPSVAFVNFFNTLTKGLPSQFVIIATTDDTRVDIDLSTGRSSVSNSATRTITLQKGQVYLVQASITPARRTDDLTGTRIRASKPVVVTSGHCRAQVPSGGDQQSSRDFLAEQMPSVDTWGKQCVIVPYMPPADEQLYGTWDFPLCRILASSNNTVVNTNGTFRTLRAGEFVDVPLTETLLVDASNPVLCAILARSANRNNQVKYSGDPFLLVVPPPEQFQYSYTIVNVEPRPGNPYFTEHWITLIAPLSAETTLRLDGASSAPLTPIAGTSLGFVHASVSAGTHRAACDSAFGIYIYGFGPQESYGYTGGMSFQRLFQPTVVLRVHTMQAAPGKLDTMIVTIDSISNTASFAAYGANRVDVDLSWNASMFVPRNSGGLLLAGVAATASKTFAFDSLRVGDTLMTIAGYHALGTDDADSILLTNAKWYSANGDTVNIITAVRNGHISTDGICLDGGTRLFDPLAKLVQQAIHNAIIYDDRGNAFLTSSQPSALSSTVDIFDTSGRLVQRYVVPANCTTPLPLASAPYEPLFVRP